MKAKGLPQEGIVLEVIENLHEAIRVKIASEVKNFIKEFIENLLIEEVTDRIGSGRYERNSKRQGIGTGIISGTCLPSLALPEDIRMPRLDREAWGSLSLTAMNTDAGKLPFYNSLKL